MQVYLAALESNMIDMFKQDIIPDDYIEFGLISYYYLKEKDLHYILKKCKRVLIDSGAHSFQHGKKINFDEYTMKYVEFVKKYTDNPKIVGFFEMDIDNVIGYEKVKEYYEMLSQVSDKIIPVWHQDRGVEDFKEMCKRHTGRRISVTGFSNNDIIDSQYNLFINTAHHYNCNVHILGMTRFPLLKTLNLHKEDSVDSSSWKQSAIFGGINLLNSEGLMTQLNFANKLDLHWKHLMYLNLLTGVQTQHHYKDKDNSLYKNTKKLGSESEMTRGDLK